MGIFAGGANENNFSRVGTTGSPQRLPFGSRQDPEMLFSERLGCRRNSHRNFCHVVGKKADAFAFVAKTGPGSGRRVMGVGIIQSLSGFALVKATLRHDLVGKCVLHKCRGYQKNSGNKHKGHSNSSAFHPNNVTR